MDVTNMPVGPERFAVVYEMVDAELATRRARRHTSAESQKMGGGGVAEFLLVQVVFSLLMSILGNAAYDVVKQEFLEWRARQGNASLDRAPMPRADTDYETELHRTLGSMGVPESEIAELVARVRTRLSADASSDEPPQA